MKTETEDNKNKIDNLMICTNWWPLIADKVIDYPQSFYDGWGVVRLHNEELFTPDNTSQLQPNDIIFAKTDFIIHEQFQNEWLDKINVPFNLLNLTPQFITINI